MKHNEASKLFANLWRIKAINLCTCHSEQMKIYPNIPATNKN